MRLRIPFQDISQIINAITIVAASATRKIRVLSFFLVSTAANVVTFQSAATAITGPMAFGANGELEAHNPLGLFETDLTEALNMLSGSAAQVSGGITYIII